MATDGFFKDDIASFAKTDKLYAGNGEVDTQYFLASSEYLVTLFDHLGPVLFSPVKTDMTGNITKIRNRYEAQPKPPAETPDSLQYLVLHEKGEKNRTGTEGLLWLLRGLDFISKALRHTTKEEKRTLSEGFGLSYTETLKKHHNFVVKGLFNAALSRAPARDEFFGKLGAKEGNNEMTPGGDFQKQYDDWLSGLEKVVTDLSAWYAANTDQKV